MHRNLPNLIVLVALFAAGGSSCPRMMQQYTQPAPRVLPPSPTLEQVVAAVNANSARVTSYSGQGTLSGPGFPPLRANVSFERPRRLRLRADTVLTGPEVDVGSNDELFWVWVKRNQPPSTFYCRHEQFAYTTAYRVMPIDPEWLIEGLGAPALPPEEQHQGPVPLGGGRLEVRSVRASSAGNLTKITVIDEARGWVLEQHMYDERGQRLATALSSRHQYDPATGVTMPRHVELQWPTAQLSFKLDMGDVQVNRLGPDAVALWTKPEFPGYTNVDLAQPMPQQPAQQGPPQYQAATPHQPGLPYQSAPPPQYQPALAPRFLTR